VLELLKEEVAITRAQEKKQESLIARGVGDRKQHAAILQRLYGEEQSELGQIQSIEDENASKAKDAADKEKAAADKRKAAREKAHKDREKDLRDRFALHAKLLANNVAAAKLTADTLVDDRKAYAAEIAYDKARAHDARLTAAERASWHAKELAAKKQLQDVDKKTTGGGSGANEAAFIAAIRDIEVKFAPNAFPVPAPANGGKSETHLYNIVNELRRQTPALHEIVKRSSFPASGYSIASAEAL
jgi:hypothetical protein